MGIEELGRIGHGAFQIDGPNEEAIKIFLAGPIKYWWSLPPDQWEKGKHALYVRWRDTVGLSFAQSGFLVYSPHRALQGAWSEMAQQINDKAIEVCDVIVDLTPVGIPHDGTTAEILLAKSLGKHVIQMPPSNLLDIKERIEDIKRWGAFL